MKYIKKILVTGIIFLLVFFLLELLFVFLDFTVDFVISVLELILLETSLVELLLFVSLPKLDVSQLVRIKHTNNTSTIIDNIFLFT